MICSLANLIRELKPFYATFPSRQNVGTADKVVKYEKEKQLEFRVSRPKKVKSIFPADHQKCSHDMWRVCGEKQKMLHCKLFNNATKWRRRMENPT